MRIAFFADNFYPELSGITDTILITSKELQKLGHDIVFVGPYYSPQDYAFGKRPLTQITHTDGSKHELIDGVEVIRLPSLPLPNSPTGQSRIALPSGKAVEFLKEWKPDIIHTNSPYGTGFEAKKAAKTLDVPLVGTNHTPIEEFYPFAPLMMQKFDAWYYNHCEFVSTPFQKLLQNMQAVGFTREGNAIANPVEHSSFTLASIEEKARIRNELKLSGPVILYVGRVAPEKHIDVVIKSIASLIQEFATITFVVTGNGSAKNDLQALTKKLHLEERVRFTGFIPQSELISYYKAADIFTILSTADSQSIALMQAFASGLPAIGARAHGLPDYIPPECGFLVEPGDMQGLTHNIQILLRDGAKRKTMSAAATEFIKQFSPEKIAEEWQSIYEKYTKK